jgi:uncharacterized protein YfaS (alpha-2-macroglobulin family)
MKNFFSVLSFFSLILIMSCSNENKNKKTNFNNYIAGHSSGIISANSQITIKLTKDIADLTAEELVDKKLLTFEPKIDGEIYWSDKRTLVFEPNESLNRGDTYLATFRLKSLIKESKKDFDFSFKVMPQNYEVTVEGITIDQDEVNIHGNVETADYTELASVEKIIKASQNGKSLKIIWNHDIQKIHNFTIQEVEKGIEKSQVLITWTGDAIGVDKEGEEVYDVPGDGEYEIVSSRVVVQDQSYISIMFSKAINEKQDLNGFITLGNQQPRYVISGNEIKLYPKQTIYGEVTLIVFRSIKNSDGKMLESDYETILKMPEAKPEVRSTGNKGTILPNSQGLIFPFEAIGLKAVDVKIIQVYEDNMLQYLQTNQLGGVSLLNRVGKPIMLKTINLQESDVTNFNKWNRFTLNLEEIIAIEPGALYQIEISFRKHQATFFCNNEDSDELEVNEDYSWDGEEESSYWDSYNNEGYDWSQRDNPCHKTYYNNRLLKHTLLASDIGLIAKKSDNGDLHVFASNLIDTKPLSNVEINIYNYQQQKIGSEVSDGNGMSTIQVTGKPFFLVAQMDGQYGYLRIDDGSSLSLSNFNISGEKIQKGIKGFIYGERGVWRPGDDIFLTFILEDKTEKLPEEYPVILELKNPQGQLVSKIVKNKSIEGIFAFNLKTDPEAPTGEWQVKIKAGGAIFNKMIKIESIKPNRLKIDLNFNKDRLTALDDLISGDLNVKWLHGAIASGLKAEYEMILSPTKTTFEDYPNFSFDDTSKNFYAERKSVFSGKLNNDGYAKVKINMNVEDNSPGALNAIFTGKVFEEGGNFSIDKQTIPFYPYKSFIGLTKPEGDRRGMLLTDKDHPIRIATVDAYGKPVSRKNVKVELYKINWRWWWDNSGNESNFLGRSSQSPIQDGIINTVNGKGSWSLNIKYPDWGRYYLKVTDPLSKHSAGLIIYVDWPGWAGKGKRGDAGGVTMLDFEIDKSTYNVGEIVKLTIPSSEGSRILVSLETGKDVLKSFSVETTAESTVIPFEASSNMTPNVYAHISLIQPHSQTANDLPIRLYGLQSIKVIDPLTTLKPKLEMPTKLRPEEKFDVKISEDNGKPMAYTLAVVDEGLLDLTRYKTPEPWSTFYAREALGIKTWDIYGDVLGAYGGKIERLLAVGGDGGEENSKGQKANRFKPVVAYLGPFLLEAGEKAIHTINMPKYIGSVRTMLIAAHKGAYGNIEETTPVKQSVMALATLPRVAGPAEEMDLPVTIFVSEDNIKSVNVSVKTSGKLELVGKNKKTLSFKRAGEAVVYFKVKAAEALGIGKVTVQAKGGGITTSYEIEMDVRASNPESIDTQDKLISGNNSWSTVYNPLGMLGTNNALVEISSLPPLNLEQRLQYLIGYPHGCIEQTTSSVFAQLYLEELVVLDEENKTKINSNIKKAIQRIRTFQTSNGGFSYWPGQSDDNSWGTNYAGHFLIEAKNNGYAIPSALFNNWVKYQRKKANQWSKNNNTDNDLVQAYRLYTLALAGKKSIGAMNRMRSINNISNAAKWRLALAYAVAGYKIPAEKMIQGLTQEVKNYKNAGYTYGSVTRDKAMILETLSYLNRREEAYPILKEIANEMGDNQRWMSTQTTAYSLIGVVAYTQGNINPSSSMSFDININNKNVKYEIGKYLTQIQIEKGEKENIIEIFNTGETPLFARLIRRGIPLVGKEIAGESHLNMNVSYISTKEEELNIKDIKQGTEFISEVTISHPGVRGDYNELALTQIFPSGWEIINTRLMGTDMMDEGDKPKYIDIRDDRTLMYFDLKRNESKTFRVRLNAAYKGNFYLPAVATEAMYDNSIYSQNTGKWVKVSD